MRVYKTDADVKSAIAEFEKRFPTPQIIKDFIAQREAVSERNIELLENDSEVEHITGEHREKWTANLREIEFLNTSIRFMATQHDHLLTLVYELSISEVSNMHDITDIAELEFANVDFFSETTFLTIFETLLERNVTAADLSSMIEKWHDDMKSNRIEPVFDEKFRPLVGLELIEDLVVKSTETFGEGDDMVIMDRNEVLLNPGVIKEHDLVYQDGMKLAEALNNYLVSIVEREEYERAAEVHKIMGIVW